MADWREERRLQMERDLAVARAATTKEPLNREEFVRRYLHEVSLTGDPVDDVELDAFELQYIYRSPAKNLEEFLADLRHLQANDMG